MDAIKGSIDIAFLEQEHHKKFLVTLEEILDAGLDILSADYGMIQIVKPHSTELEIVVQRGLSLEFLKYLDHMPLRSILPSEKDMASYQRGYTIEEMKTNSIFKEYLKQMGTIPFHAMQLTPLFDWNGTLLGLFSAYFRKSHPPSEKSLHMMDLYASQAAHVIELLGVNTLQKKDNPVSVQSSTDTNKTPSLKLISTLPFFSDLNDNEKTELLHVAHFKHYRRGEMIFHVGDPMTHLSWVCIGAVQKFRETPDGREITAAIRIIGDMLFDQDALGHKHVHTMNAKALQNTTLLTLPAEWIDTNMKSWDNLTNKFMELLAQRAQKSQIETEHQATMNASQIVACFLQNLCETHHLDPKGFTLPYTKSVIASRLGMELESLSRVLPKLRNYGIIVRGKQVSFTNIAAAQNLSCSHCSVEEDCPTHQTMCALNSQKPAPKNNS